MIIDASVAVSWLIETPFSTNSRKLQPPARRGPALLLVETANVLLKYHRFAKISLEEIEAALRQLRVVVPDLTEDRALLPMAFGIAARSSHKIYDCLYLALALERGEPLATADKRLAALAQKLNIDTQLIGPEP
ncbi:type II toxin-antitoxin system VapC family toxin [Mesorhizobium sp. WSM2239]|uniref:Ribonuclease VapC n=2 Tax=unclassified Mesorhizobium TaxID=325217 RepID=A0AAU8D2P2_9HYPH